MLHSIAGPIDMHVEIALVILWVATLVRSTQLEHASQGLEWILSLDPFEVVLGILCTSMHHVQKGFRKFCPLIEWQFVLAPLVCKMDFEPVQAILS